MDESHIADLVEAIADSALDVLDRRIKDLDIDVPFTGEQMKVIAHAAAAAAEKKIRGMLSRDVEPPMPSNLDNG
jgi:hypothetical protein